jgi:hypothetical protein
MTALPENRSHWLEGTLLEVNPELTSMIISGEIIDQIVGAAAVAPKGPRQGPSTGHFPLVPLISQLELIHTVLSHPVESFETTAPSAEP